MNDLMPTLNESEKREIQFSYKGRQTQLLKRFDSMKKRDEQSELASKENVEEKRSEKKESDRSYGRRESMLAAGHTSKCLDSEHRYQP